MQVGQAACLGFIYEAQTCQHVPTYAVGDGGAAGTTEHAAAAGGGTDTPEASAHGTAPAETKLAPYLPRALLTKRLARRVVSGSWSLARVLLIVAFLLSACTWWTVADGSAAAPAVPAVLAVPAVPAVPPPPTAEHLRGEMMTTGAGTPSPTWSKRQMISATASSTSRMGINLAALAMVKPKI